MQNIRDYLSEFDTADDLIKERDRLIREIKKVERRKDENSSQEIVDYLENLNCLMAVVGELRLFTAQDWGMEYKIREFDGLKDEDMENGYGITWDEWDENDDWENDEELKDGNLDQAIAYWMNTGYRAELNVEDKKKHPNLRKKLKRIEKIIRKSQPRVRVKDGVKDIDPDAPDEDFDFSGFTGHLVEQDTDGIVFVLFDEESQRRLPESYKRKALENGEEWDSYCFEAEDIEINP